jgi:uncharacterized SAM-binding protein YcdF (DUF218 family)
MRVFLTVIFLVVLAYAIGFVLFVSNLPATPSVPPQVDGIVVPTGGDQRLQAAVALLEQGVGKRLLISGVSPTTTKEEVGKLAGGSTRFACCADLGYAAEDTHGNAVEAADWTRSNHYDSIAIVTSRYHTPRTMREFSVLLPDVTLIAYPVDQSGVDLGNWWTHPRTMQLLHREYAKFLASLVITKLNE